MFITIIIFIKLACESICNGVNFYYGKYRIIASMKYVPSRCDYFSLCRQIPRF